MDPVRHLWFCQEVENTESPKEDSAKIQIYPTAFLNHMVQTVVLSSSNGKTEEEDGSIVGVVEPVHQRVVNMCAGTHFKPLHEKIKRTEKCYPIPKLAQIGKVHMARTVAQRAMPTCSAKTVMRSTLLI